MNPGKLGVWCFHDLMDTKTATECAQRIEKLGYATLWHPETTGRDPFAHAAHLLARTERLALATGIANIYHRHPGAMIQGARTVAEHSGGRFVLGIGVSHAPMVQLVRGLDYGKPVATMRSYLESMRSAPYTAARPAEEPPIVLAALGPKMLALAASDADGAHPYWTTPEHTRQAREIMGPDALLCVEQKIVLETDPQRARDAGRAALGMYKSLPNYRNTWLRLGFSDADIDTDGGSDGLLDALVAWGDAQAIRDRVEAHWAAGADHVCIQPLAPDGQITSFDWNALEALAPNQ
jgi:probable F420-dependent oxidoreductase